MENLIVSTEFAPAERESLRIVDSQLKAFTHNSILSKIVNTFSEMLVALNDKRQIIFANDSFISAIGINKKRLSFKLKRKHLQFLH